MVYSVFSPKKQNGQGALGSLSTMSIYDVLDPISRGLLYDFVYGPVLGALLRVYYACRRRTNPNSCGYPASQQNKKNSRLRNPTIVTLLDASTQKRFSFSAIIFSSGTFRFPPVTTPRIPVGNKLAIRKRLELLFPEST